jgi:acylphosphatase
VAGGVNTHQRLEATVRGDVQGVGFRWFVRRQAAQLPITGWVANESDGSVHVVAEGPREALHILLGQLQDGPPGSSVKSVEESWSGASGSFSTFEIKAGGHSGD